ncbi:hypothetical protein ER57_09850 [Smithella sp. SCADC]|jgi:hypothetical protein|nr:hypothetical protein ER57_09850 [Smithella sp. SCADC]
MKQEKTKQESVLPSQKLHQVADTAERGFKTKRNCIRNFFFIFAIFIAGIIAYSNSFDCSFHFDDANFFEKIDMIGSAGISDWLKLFPSRPIGTLTFALNYHFHGLDVRG